MRRVLVILGAFVMCLISMVSRSSAQEPDSTKPAMQPVIFVPYDQLNGPQLDLDQSVLLPYAEFLKLRDSRPPEARRVKPAAALSQSQFTGEILENVVLLTGRLSIETIAEAGDSLALTFPFKGAAIESIRIEGNSATVVPLSNADGFGLRLLGPGTRNIEVRLAVPIQARPGSSRIVLGIPRSPAGSLQLNVPGNIELLDSVDSIAARLETVRDNDTQRQFIRASIGARDSIQLEWKTRVERTGEAARTRFIASHALSLDLSENTTLARDNLTIECLSGVVDQLRLRLPANSRLINISGPFLKDWSEPGQDGLIPVVLVRSTGERIALSIDLELETGTDVASALQFGGLEVMGAVRESGSIIIQSSENLSVWPESHDGLINKPIEGNTGSLRAFEFAQPGWQLVLARRVQTARVRAAGLQLYEATRQYTRLKTRHVLNISGRSIFSVGFEIPEGFDVVEAGPEAVVATRTQEGRIVELTLKGEQLGQCVIDLLLQRVEQAENRNIDLIPVRVIRAEEDSGTMILAAPAAIRTTEIATAGYEPTDVRPFLAQLRGLISSEVSPALGYRYFNGTESASASLERQRTRTTCETSIMATIQPTLMRMNATFNFNVEFSPDDTFELMLPAYAGNDVAFIGADIKEKTRGETAGADGMTTWTIKLQQRVMGAYPLRVAFDREISTARMGQATSVTVPLIHAVNVARETGAVAISRGENLEVRVADSTGLEARDIKELPSQLAQGYIGFRYFDATKAQLELQLIRHELEAVLGALVRRLHIETIVNDQREVVHEVWLEIQNNREQYLELDLPANTQIWSAFVRGKPVRSTTRQSDQARLIELEKSESLDSAFRVRLILRESLSGGQMGSRGHMNLKTVVPLNMPVLRTSWKLYLPRGYRYVDFGGSMNLETGVNLPWIEPNAEFLLNDLPASVAGGIADPALNPPLATAPVSYTTEETDAEKQARLQGVALEIPIVREGLQFQFSKLSGVGDITVDYWKIKPLVIFQIIIALLVFGGMIGLALWRRHPAIPSVVAILFFLFASLTDGMAGRIFATSMGVSLLALALILTSWLVHKSRHQNQTSGQ